MNTSYTSINEKYDEPCISLSRPQPKNKINKIHFMWGKNTIRKFFFSKWIFLLQRFKNEEKNAAAFE